MLVHNSVDNRIESWGMMLEVRVKSGQNWEMPLNPPGNSGGVAFKAGSSTRDNYHQAVANREISRRQLEPRGATEQLPH